MGRPAATVRKPYDAETLTNVAMRVFAERGYDGASLEDIAAAAGIAKSSVYHHVAGKEDLLARGLSRGLQRFFELLNSEEATNGRAIDCLRFVVSGATQGLVANEAEDLACVKIMMSMRGMTPTEQWARGRWRESQHRMAALVKRAIREGDIRRDVDAQLITRLLFGMIASITDWFDAGDADSGDQITAAILALAFEGIEPRR